MTARNQHIIMNEGESKLIDVSHTDDLDNGGDLDMTGYQSLTWYVKEYENGPILLEKDDGSADVVVNDASIGAYEITINPVDTDGLVDGAVSQFYHKVRLVDPDGRETDLLEGTMTVEAS